jgi:hypothetical protein
MNVRSDIEVILKPTHSHFLCYGAAYAELLSYDLFSDSKAFKNILWTQQLCVLPFLPSNCSSTLTEFLMSITDLKKHDGVLKTNLEFVTSFYFTIQYIELWVSCLRLRKLCHSVKR